MFGNKKTIRAFVIAGLVLLVHMAVPPLGLAHEEQKPVTVEKERTKGPFVFVLPADGGPYAEIMKPPRTVTMRSGLVTLAPGKDVGLHSTENNEEMLVILEGHGEVELEGFGRMAIAAGRTAYVPPKTRHNILNKGSGPLKYVFIVSKAIE
ncbi:MAG TPA: cupin domain-containing protein [Syntrophales bacterium]|nr:cupin domain-containing protein [Syntrophales bacterium]HPI58485.1 cupin domain-containing protein [Syntrophales bacterium]HPN26214.1 cupin domain-containing protein [Syntrophales bacterium]